MQNDGSVSRLKRFFSNKWVVAILSANAVAIIVIIAILISNSTKTATVNFNIAPLNAKIQIDGGGEYYNGAYQIHPGSHTITVSREGLTTKTFTMDFPSDYSTTVCTFLSDDGNLEFYELRDNYESFQQLVAIASAQNNITTDHDTSAEAFIADIQQAYQLFELLPIIDKTPTQYGFSNGINYAYDYLKIMDGSNNEACTKTLCLYITDTTERGEDFAISIIKRFGYNPNSFQIIYEKVGYEDS